MISNLRVSAFSWSPVAATQSVHWAVHYGVIKYLSIPAPLDNSQWEGSLNIRMTSPVSQFSARLVRMSRLSPAIGVSKVKSCQPAAASYQVISVVQQPTILTRNPEQAEENIVEQKVETVTPIAPAPLPPLPSKRWEMQSAVKIPSVNISITNSSESWKDSSTVI